MNDRQNESDRYAHEVTSEQEQQDRDWPAVELANALDVVCAALDRSKFPMLAQAIRVALREPVQKPVDKPTIPY